jgi:hypothetical protein
MMQSFHHFFFSGDSSITKQNKWVIDHHMGYYIPSGGYARPVNVTIIDTAGHWIS